MLMEDFDIQKGNGWNNNEIWIRGKGGIEDQFLGMNGQSSLDGLAVFAFLGLFLLSWRK